MERGCHLKFVLGAPEGPFPAPDADASSFSAHFPSQIDQIGALGTHLGPKYRKLGFQSNAIFQGTLAGSAPSAGGVSPALVSPATSGAATPTAPSACPAPRASASEGTFLKSCIGVGEEEPPEIRSGSPGGTLFDPGFGFVVVFFTFSAKSIQMRTLGTHLGLN